MRFKGIAAADRAETEASEPPAFRQGAWYADPYGQAELRWWDGTQWTRHVHGETVIQVETFTTHEAPATPVLPAAEVAEPALDAEPEVSDLMRRVLPYIAAATASTSEI